ncbi:MAG TPA: arylesterase, partial [Burkholderiaceae bacterium]
MPVARAMARPTKVLVVGDSLSAEYGLPRGSGWVALLEQRLAKERVGATVVN